MRGSGSLHQGVVIVADLGISTGRGERQVKKRWGINGLVLPVRKNSSGGRSQISGERGLSKDQAWGRVSEVVGKEEAKASMRKMGSGRSRGTEEPAGPSGSCPCHSILEPLVWGRLRELHELERN